MVYGIVEGIKNRRVYRDRTWCAVYSQVQNETFVYCKERLVLTIGSDRQVGGYINIQNVTKYNVTTLNAILSGLGCVNRVRVKNGKPFFEVTDVEPKYFLRLYENV